MKGIKRTKIYKALRKNQVTYFLYEKTIQKIRLALMKKNSKKDLEAKIEDVHALGYQIVEMAERILGELGLSYFAEFGTLLGFVREKGFIKWDDDLDYAFILEDDSVWKKIEAKMVENGFSKIREFTFEGKITEQCYQFGKATIDIFSHRITEGGKSTTIAYYRDPEIKYKHPDIVSVLYGEFVNLSQTMLVALDNGMNVHVPQNYDEYLTQVYGNWRIPDPNYKDGSGPVVKKLKGVYGHVEHF